MVALIFLIAGSGSSELLGDTMGRFSRSGPCEIHSSRLCRKAVDLVNRLPQKFEDVMCEKLQWTGRNLCPHQLTDSSVALMNGVGDPALDGRFVKQCSVVCHGLSVVCRELKECSGGCALTWARRFLAGEQNAVDISPLIFLRGAAGI
jgi:hypothetical protein